MTPIEQVVEGANAVATINSNFKANRGAFVGAFNQATSIDLTFGLYGGDWNGLSIDADTVTLTDDDDNYIVMDVSDGSFSAAVTTTDWNNDADYKRICLIAAAGGMFVENQIKDWRYSPGGLFYGDGTGGGGGADDQCIYVASSDESSALTTGTAKVTFRTPFAFTLSEVRASVTTAPTGAALQVDINAAGSSILSTKLTIDATEKTSKTAATPAVISDTTIDDDAEITIDIDVVGSTIAGAGLKVYFIGRPT